MALEKMKFYLVKPQAATNYVTNPTPYLATTGYTASVGTIALTDDASRRGPGCIEVTPTTALSGVYFGTVAVVNTQNYAFSVDVKGETGKAMRIRVEDAGGTYTYETEFTATGNWQRVSVAFTAQETASDYRLYVLRDATTGTAVFYVDGFQFEDDKETTFFSGDTQGFDTGRLEFGWNGTPHASTSYRTVNTNAGGVLVDLDDYSKLSGIFGLGSGTYTQLLTDLISGGSYYQGNIRKSRIFSLLLHYTGSLAKIQADRKAVLDLVKPAGQEMVIRYQGFSGIEGDGDEATEPLDIVCVPQPSHGDPGQRPAQQEALLNFTIPSGVLDGAYKEGKELGTSEDIADANRIIQQDLITGQWAALDAGLGGSVRAMAIADSGDLYVGGNFTTASGVTVYYTARWNGSTWSALGGSFNNLNSSVRDIAIAANGDLYAGGWFTTATGGIANRIARWNGSSWSALGTGLDDQCESVTLAPDGTLYVGGYFANAGGVACGRIAKWDGSSWSSIGALSGGVGGPICRTLVTAPNGDLYAGGTFATAGGFTVSNIAKYDGSSWSALGTGVNSSVRALAIAPNGDLYAAGGFTEASGVTVNYIARWNGSTWSALGTGLSSGAYTLAVSPNNDVYVGGVFGSAGGISLSDKIAVYRSGAWEALSVNLPGTPIVYSVAVSENNKLFIGHDTAGTAVAEVRTQLTVNTQIDAYPLIKIIGPGAIQSITNHTTGKQIQFNGLTLNAGEIFMLDLNPTNIRAFSNWRSNLHRFVITGADLASFQLAPGANNISLLMPSGTTGDTKAYIEYTPRFDGIEGALHE